MACVIASFQNEERTKGFDLGSDGTLWMREREHPGDMWSPPEPVVNIYKSVPEFDAFLASLSEKYERVSVPAT